MGAVATPATGGLLTLGAYHDTGGVSGALAKRADEVYDGLHSSPSRGSRTAGSCCDRP